MANSSYLQNLPSYGSSGSGPSSADSAMSGRLRIDYKMFNELMQLVYGWSKDLRMSAQVFEQTYPCVVKTGANAYLKGARQWEQRAGEALAAVGSALGKVQFLTAETEDWVRSAVYDWDNWNEAIEGAGLAHAGASFADEYYEEFAQKTQQDADDADMMALVMAWIASEFPETNAEYQQKLAEEEEQRMLAFLQKHDLPMYHQIVAEKERRRKAAEEAAKAAEEAEKAMDELGEGYDGADLGGSDLGGSDFGGSDWGGSDFGGSDLGGSGWDGSDWSSEDWGSDLLADSLVESALPPVGEIVERIFQPLAFETCGTKADDGNLLPCMHNERAVVMTRNKHAIISKQTYVSSLAHILHEQRDIAQRMVVTLASGTQYGELPLALRHQVAHSLAQVVGLLLLLEMAYGGIPFFQLWG